MRVLVYWALGGVGGVQRFDAFLTKALCELGLDVTVLMPSGLGLDFVRRFHGVDLSGCRGLVVARYGSLDCGNIYCGLVASLLGNMALRNAAGDYDLVFLDTPFLWPFDWRRAKNVVFYLHAALTAPRPRPILTAKLHRFFYFSVTSMARATTWSSAIPTTSTPTAYSRRI